jgi:archaellum component FlaF (FlaF/FlaG flagellin family)
MLSISTMFLSACIMVSSMCVCVCMLEGTYFVYFTHTHIDEAIIQADRNMVEIDNIYTF